MTLSIITINYNNKAGLQKTIDSVISQTWKDFEWLVIDGGSSDGSRELIEQHQDAMAYWCSEPDRGIYHAMNKGIAKAHGEYLQFLNSGDYLADSIVLEKTFHFINHEPLYVGNIYAESNIGKFAVDPKCNQPPYLLNTLINTSLCHPASFIRRDLFEKYGNYREDKKLVSDWWFFFKAIVLGNIEPVYFPVAVVVYNENGISSNNHSLGIEKEELLCENPTLGQLVCFYRDNHEIITAIKDNRIAYFIFRLYFFIYRQIIRRLKT